MLEYALLGVLGFCLIVAGLIVKRKDEWKSSMSYHAAAIIWVIIGTYIVASGGAVGKLLDKFAGAQAQIASLEEKNSELAKLNQRYELAFKNTFGNVKIAKGGILTSKEALEKLMGKRAVVELTGPASAIYFAKIKGGLGETAGSLQNIEMSFKQVGLEDSTKDLPYKE